MAILICQSLPNRVSSRQLNRREDDVAGDDVTDDLRDPATPASVKIKTEARRPETDPRVGVALAAPAGPPPQHRLVTIGDSLTHGFQSGAIYNTQISYPRI